MKKLIILISLLLPVKGQSEQVNYMTDYTCVTRCQMQGYQYGLCMRQCSY